MFKPMYIILFGILLSITITYGASFSNDDDDVPSDLPPKQVHSQPSMKKKKISIPSNDVENEETDPSTNDDESEKTPTNSNEDESSTIPFRPAHVRPNHRISDDDTSGFTRSQSRFDEEMLQAHNNYRTRHCAPPLRLDNDLSQQAQDYAERLAHSNGVYQNSAGGYGRNIYTKSSSASLGSVDGKEATRFWYDGMKYYDFDQGGFAMNTGSFTQVVWKRSRQLGVGIAYTLDKNVVYVVALYSPPGNIAGQFQQNVFATGC